MSYSAQQLHDLWLKAVQEVDHRTPDAGDKLHAWEAAAVALAESGGDPNNTGHNKNGTVDRGLWQINSVHGAQSTYDPDANARAAYEIWRDAGPSWRPWATAWSHPFSSGYGDNSAPAWKILASPSFKKASKGQEGGVAQGPTDIPIVGPIIGGVNGLLSWTQALGKLLANLLDPKFWLRIGQGLAAVLLLFMGLGLMFRHDAMALGKLGAV